LLTDTRPDAKSSIFGNICTCTSVSLAKSIIRFNSPFLSDGMAMIICSISKFVTTSGMDATCPTTGKLYTCIFCLCISSSTKEPDVILIHLLLYLTVLQASHLHPLHQQ